jgi:glycosyltransferase involved in cell wall biosynthesis
MSSTENLITYTQQTTQESAAGGLSVVIPAYNEEQGIHPVLDSLVQDLAALDVPYEILVVDDGSQDNTARIIREHSHVRLVTHERNRGYGAALKTGIRFATYDLICITDADGTYPNERIPELLARLHEHHSDMVVGARTGEHVRIPLVRRPAKWFIARMASFVAGEPIPDINSGLRLFRRGSVLPFWNVLPAGFSFTTTITLCMLTNDYLVNYMPIDYHARAGKSKIKPIRDTWNFIKLILRMALYFAPLKIFLPISLLLFALAVGWGFYSAFVIGRLADLTTSIIAMTAVQVGIFGLLAEIMRNRWPGK